MATTPISVLNAFGLLVDKLSGADQCALGGATTGVKNSMGPFQGGEFWLDEKVVIRWAFQLTTNQIRVSRVTIHKTKRMYYQLS